MSELIGVTGVNRGVWRDVLETVIIRRKLTDTQGQPFHPKEALFKPNLADYAKLHQTRTTLRTFENKRKETYIKSNTPHK